MDEKSDETPVELIPGIGIIRARALKKAGWPTVGSLRSASAEDLLAVRGITDVKAAQILDYIRALAGSAPAAEEAPPSPPAPEPRPRAARAPRAPKAPPAPPAPLVEAPPAPPETITVTFDEPGTADEQVPVFTIQSPRDLMQDVALSAQLLLTSEFAGKWQQPFAQQLGKLITLHERWERYEPLSKKQTKQALELLQKIYRLLTETPVAELTKRKSQERLAELLRDRRRRVRDILKS